MAELLLELFSEEIPARMQAKAAADLQKLVTDALASSDVFGEAAKAFVTPRRLTLCITGLPVAQADRKEERKGPRVGAPEKALAGFLKSTGLTIEQCEQREDKKGSFYVAVIEKKGQPLPDLIAEIVPNVIRNFPWAKSMRWGNGILRWVRPLQSILCVFDGEVVPFDVDGIKSGNTSKGHRFLAPESFTAHSFEDYEEKLSAHRVMLDAADRAEHIWADAQSLAQAQGLELIDDQALLKEVSGLIEWPTVFMGKIDDEFMGVPQEVLTSTMRANQKYFALRDPKTGALAPRFIVVSNIDPDDAGAAVINGNERVLRARFSDARFLWDEDKKNRLEDYLPKLEKVVFHAKLGTVAEKTTRISTLASALAQITGADKALAEQAGALCKADLVSGMVFEFPELQGLMGQYYAKNDGLDVQVADAIAQHYQPQGPSDDVPTGGVALAVSLADKLDTLIGFWSIDEKPTGSKDPYALRRAALGIIRMILEGNLRAPLLDVFAKAGGAVPENEDLLSFFGDRLKVHLRDKGTRHDLVDAVFALGGQDDLVLIVKRVEALSSFLDTDDGKNLLAGYKRAINILRAEEKKDGAAYQGTADASLFEDDAERALFAQIEEASREAATAVGTEDFAAAMSALAKLRAPVDRFFEDVVVNAEDAGVRKNRLVLLSQIRSALGQVANFSKVEG
ncbi:MAG: glycine--tRNA ligase subunit beta [Parvibaculaceae bacterium]|nr:glycine--tRNA ligase subunit beta [Parvibaculaceae bacterium]